MRFVADHDYHIHSYLSPCSSDPLQTPDNILMYAESNNFKKIVVTDHFWDRKIPNKYIPDYGKLDLEYISKNLPLPSTDNVKFLFGCETEMDRDMNIAVDKSHYDKFDFIIIPTTHLHMSYKDDELKPEERAKIYVDRFDAVMDSDLPFHKVGIAHLTCHLLAPLSASWETHINILELISNETFERLFKRASEAGVGIELNFDPFRYSCEEIDKILRPYKIAKQCGCKFYMGSDAHTGDELTRSMKKFNRIIDLLELEESDKFYF